MALLYSISADITVWTRAVCFLFSVSLSTYLCKKPNPKANGSFGHNAYTPLSYTCSKIEDFQGYSFFLIFVLTCTHNLKSTKKEGKKIFGLKSSFLQCFKIAAHCICLDYICHGRPKIFDSTIFPNRFFRLRSTACVFTF